ncbi:MAG: hypothetical protein JSS14_22085 [Proteobacteria bacterium]|nr:hypothetical protein [Pseudomonadota bacterium]
MGRKEPSRADVTRLEAEIQRRLPEILAKDWVLWMKVQGPTWHNPYHMVRTEILMELGDKEAIKRWNKFLTTRALHRLTG